MCDTFCSGPGQMLVPLERYLTSPETDETVLNACRTALARGAVTAARNPALHRIATALASRPTQP